MPSLASFFTSGKSRPSSTAAEAIRCTIGVDICPQAHDVNNSEANADPGEAFAAAAGTGKAGGPGGGAFANRFAAGAAASSAAMRCLKPPTRTRFILSGYTTCTMYIYIYMNK